MTENPDKSKIRQYMCTAVKDGMITRIDIATEQYELERFERYCKRTGAEAQYMRIDKDFEHSKPIKYKSANAKRNDVKVRCIETDEVFPTVSALHKTLPSISRWTLDLRIKNHMAVQGKHYEIIH